MHPAWRRLGIGGHAFDWAAGRAGSSALRAETETLNAGAHALYRGKGLSQVFAEDVMQLAASVRPPATHAPDGLILSQWGQAAPRFYAVYATSPPPPPDGSRRWASCPLRGVKTSAPG